jgi:rsbT antagonist protein RsbS
MARVPIVRVGDVLIASVQEELRDQDALTLQDELCEALERSESHGVLLDLSLVETVDSYLGRLLRDIALGARLLGAHTVVVGIRPAVAITLVELGLELPEKGLALLRRLRVAEWRRIGRNGR